MWRYLLLCPLCAVADPDDWIDVGNELKNKLLHNYDPTRIPVQYGRPVNVSLYMWPYDILYVNEAKSSIKFCGWFDMYWIDYLLAWKPEDNYNVTHIFVQSSQIWLPKIDIFYSKEEGAKIELCKECYVKVDYTGQVLRGMYFTYSFPCKINVKYFPFDRQNCTLEVANWFLDDRMMDLWPRGSLNVDLSVFLPNEEWDLQNITTLRKNEFYNYGNFPSLSYHIGLKRKPFYYICNLIAPSVIITVIATVGYHMPSTSTGVHQEKAKMGLTAILSIFILQLGISDKMPRTSDVVPLISIFYFCLVIILGLCILSTSLIILTEKQALYGKHVPRILKKLFFKRWKTCTCKKEHSALKGVLACRCPDYGAEDARLLGTTSLSRFSTPERLSANRPSTTTEFRWSTAPNGVSRTLDGGCARLYSTTDQESTANCASLSPNCHRCYVALDRMVDELNKVRANIERWMRDSQNKAALKAEWMHLADCLERISFYIFIISIGSGVLDDLNYKWFFNRILTRDVATFLAELAFLILFHTKQVVSQCLFDNLTRAVVVDNPDCSSLTNLPKSNLDADLRQLVGALWKKRGEKVIRIWFMT